MSRVELFETIRRDHRDLGLSIRALAAKHHVHRRVVRQALVSAVPPARKAPERAAPALGPHKARIDKMLTDDETAPRKQRHTARRIWQRLVDEHGAELAESTVRAYVGERRREMRNLTKVVTIPQLHEPGAEAEVDFGEVYLTLDGVLTKCFMFAMRLSCSGRAVHRVYATQAQEAFFDGHNEAFAAFGGVPHRIRYDNLTPAVARVLEGRNREENERFVALRSHYGFDSFFCIPGIDGAHEKGGIEGEIGRFRRNRLVPVPKGADLVEVNERCREGDRADDARHISTRKTTVGEDFLAEAAFLLALPADVFDAARYLPQVRVDQKARVCVRQCYYSVPASLAGRSLSARLSATTVQVLSGRSVVATHPRLVHRGSSHLVLDHYLPVLFHKPGALAGSVALAQARREGVFCAEHEAFWDTARRRLGDGEGTRALCEVLLLHRRLPDAAVRAGIAAALSAGTIEAKIVALEARRAADAPSEEAARSAVVVLAEHHGTRPVPGLGGYDALLTEVAG